MNKIIIKKAFIPLLAIGLLSISSSSFAKKEVVMEKCTGLAKTGMGDGSVTIDGKTKEWLLMPAGQCQKFIGGKVYIEKK
jgi:uncharacterized membrane protein